MDVKDKGLTVRAVGAAAVKDTTRIMLLRIAEQEKTRRLLIVLTAILVVFGSCLMVFAPQGREDTSIVIGLVLLVLAMGSIGVSQFIVKAPGWEVSTEGAAAKPSADAPVPGAEAEAGKSKPDRTIPS